MEEEQTQQKQSTTVGLAGGHDVAVIIRQPQVSNLVAHKRVQKSSFLNQTHTDDVCTRCSTQSTTTIGLCSYVWCRGSFSRFDRRFWRSFIITDWRQSNDTADESTRKRPLDQPTQSARQRCMEETWSTRSMETHEKAKPELQGQLFDALKSGYCNCSRTKSHS